ncbi:MAG: tetratricopeptide repeat protein [Thermodesulfobacteriota bacterium]
MAATTDKPSRKELLKGPDEFVTFTAKMVTYARDNQNKIFAAVISILVVILLVLGARYYLNRQENQAQRLLEDAQTDFVAARDSSASSDKLAQVEEKFTAVRTQYPRTDAARLALINRANVRLARGQAAAAAEDFAEAQKAFARDPLMQSVIQSGLAYAYEEQKDYAKALELFSGIASGQESVYAEDAALALPRLYEAMGKTDEAKKAYEDFAKKYPDSPFTAFAREKAARLG